MEPAAPVLEPASSPASSGGRVLAALGAAMLILLAYRGYAPQLAARPTTLEVARLDLNTADVADLEQVPGLGPTRAAAVVQHRAAYGPFTPEAGLDNVKGIGPHTAAKAAPFLMIPPTSVPTVEVLERKPPPPVKPQKLAPGDPPLDLNTASETELQRLPGVGPALAQRIRAARPFKSIDELDRVPGIGRKTLEKLRPVVVIRPEG